MKNQFKEQIMALSKRRENIYNSLDIINTQDETTEDNDFHLVDLPYSSMPKIKTQDLWKVRAVESIV